ncbi:MAG: cysteine desulfurase family protein [Pseudomonadota bacterium]
MTKTYLDYNATAPIRPEVIDLVTQVMGEVGNASSVHGHGRAARKYVEDARMQVATLCGVDPDQVIFTSGATEATNAMLSHYRDKKTLISAIEHPAVIDSLPDAIHLPVTKDGVVDLKIYKEKLQSEKPELVSVMLVNSETGVIQPIEEMAALAHEHDALFHTEVVQAAGRMDISLDKLDVDAISLSAHKFAGPQGVGALILRKGLDAPKFMRGGGQEKNCRAGTHNTAGIAGMGLAAEIALKEMSDYQTRIQKMRDDLETKIKEITGSAIIYGENTPRIHNTTNVGLPSCEAQTQLMALDLDGIAVSSGSACSSGTFKPSAVLMAMGVSEEEAKCALRLSLGWNTTPDDIDRFIESWSKLVKRVSK